MRDPVALDLRLLNDYQRDFPLVSRPYAQIATQLGLDESAVIAAYGEGLARKVVSRIGAVVAPRRIGASTLAAMAVPKHRLEAVATSVNAHAEVNHNYEREDEWNLWFVVTARDAARRAEVLGELADETGLTVLSLPLIDEYHIDLGFDLYGAGGPRAEREGAAAAPCALPGIESALLAALEDGLPLSPRPFADLGARAGISEDMTLSVLEGWLRDGLLKRFGVVVRHRELGYTENAMCVWDVPDEQVVELGRQLATVPGVTLCYRRERALPHWPYNLYCMIHGKQRDDVLTLRAGLADRLGLDRFPHRILFSRRCFKQCGARYATGRDRQTA